MAGGARSSAESEDRLVRAVAGLLTMALEGMEDGAIAAGLAPTTARAFVRQTLLTTALLLREHGCSPAELKDQVASPGGTTIAGLAVLEDHAVRGAFIRAVEMQAAKAPHPGSAGASHGAANND